MSALGRIQSVTKDANATLLLARILFWAGRKKGGVHHDDERWSYRSVEGWAGEAETGLSPTQVERALKKLDNLNLIVRKTRVIKSGYVKGRVLLVRPTARALALEVKDKLESETPYPEDCGGDTGESEDDKPADSGVSYMKNPSPSFHHHFTTESDAGASPGGSVLPGGIWGSEEGSDTSSNHSNTN